MPEAVDWRRLLCEMRIEPRAEMRHDERGSLHDAKWAMDAGRDGLRTHGPFFEAGARTRARYMLSSLPRA